MTLREREEIAGLNDLIVQVAGCGIFHTDTGFWNKGISTCHTLPLTFCGVEASLAAIVDDRLVGFLLAQVYYGKFATTEKNAVLDSLDVHPRFRGRGIGHALIDQLKLNLRALRINQLATSVRWQDQELLSFFHRSGFVPDAKINVALGVC